MPTGHARTAALLRSGHPGDLPVRRGHPLFGRRLSGDLACFPAGDCRGPGASPHGPGRVCPRIEHLASGPGGAALKETLNTTTARALVMQLVMQVPGWLPKRGDLEDHRRHRKKPLSWSYPAQGRTVSPVGLTGFEPATP